MPDAILLRKFCFVRAGDAVLNTHLRCRDVQQRSKLQLRLGSEFRRDVLVLHEWLLVQTHLLHRECQDTFSGCWSSPLELTRFEFC